MGISKKIRNTALFTVTISVFIMLITAVSAFACDTSTNLYRVSGISMEPTLHDGDVVKLVPGPVSDGDIVIADTGCRDVLHTSLVVKRVAGDWLIGDNLKHTAVFRLSDVKVMGKVQKLNEASPTLFLKKVQAVSIIAEGEFPGGDNYSFTSTALSNGNAMITSADGGPDDTSQWRIMDSLGNKISEGECYHFARYIYAACQFSGYVMLAGDRGCWYISDQNGNEVSHGIYGGTSNYTIYTATALSDGKVLLAGRKGKWRIEQTLFPKNGTWIHGNTIDIKASAELSNGNIILVGDQGKWQIINSDGNNVANGTWIHGANDILSAYTLPNGNTIMAGEAGKWEIINSAGSNIKNGTWIHNQGIDDVNSLSNNRILLLGSNYNYGDVRGKAAWQIIDYDGNNIENRIDTYGPSNWNSSAIFPNGNVLVSGYGNAGSSYNWRIYNFNAAPTVTTQAVSSIAQTTATGNGNVTALGVPNPTQHGHVWSTSANPTVSLATKTTLGAKNTTGAFTSSITGLTAGTTYYVKAYATNTAETSYGSEVSFTTTGTVPVGDITMTDRVTAANIGVDPHKNRYMPMNEVIVRVDIDPKAPSVGYYDKCFIKIYLNTSGTVPGMGTYQENLEVDMYSNIGVGKLVNNNIEYVINNPSRTPYNVYFTFKFDKKNKLAKLNNTNILLKAEVVHVRTADGIANLKTSFLPILIRDAKVSLD